MRKSSQKWYNGSDGKRYLGALQEENRGHYKAIGGGALVRRVSVLERRTPR